MKRIAIVLLVLATATIVASPVGAAPPDCVDRPNHPSCQGEDPPDDEAAGGTTCAAIGEWGTPVVDGVFTITLSGKKASACVDVMAREGAWTVEIDTQGTVRSLMLVPRDSIGPGDSCGGFFFRGDIPASIVLPGPDHPSDFDGDEMIEGSYANSCGEQFGELVDGVYYATVDTSVPSPLAFQIDMTGSSDAEVVLTVYLP